MTNPARQDFSIDGIACRWQPRPTDTFANARHWVAGIAGDAAAGGLQRDVRGRPRLPAGLGDIGWSHSGDRMLLAHVASGTLGVDIELQARRVDALRIARRYFAASEIALLETLQSEPRRALFLRLWCAKEAVLKAHGQGIAFGLSRAVIDASDGTLRLARCDPTLGDVANWRLHAFSPEPGYLAVLAHHDGILRA